MGQQIIKQPNNGYCIFSSIVDNVTYYNMSKQGIIDLFVLKEKKHIEQKVNEIITKLDNKEKPYYNFTMNYEEMIKKIKEIHGNQESNTVKSLIEL